MKAKAATRKKPGKRKKRRKSAAAKAQSAKNLSVPLQTSSALRRVVGAALLSRQDATRRLWEYVSEHNLKREGGTVCCDEALAAVFGTSEFCFTDVAGVLARHLKRTETGDAPQPSLALRAVAAVVRRCRSLLSIVQGTDVHSATRPAAHDRVREPAPAASAPRPSAAAVGDLVLCSAALTAVLQGRQPGEASERQIWLNRAELTRRVVEVSQANPARFLAVRQLLGVLPLDVADVDAQLHAHIVSVKPSSGPSAPLSNATKARPDPSRFITSRPAPAAPASAALASTMGGAVGASVVARAAEAASASAAPMHAAAEQIVGQLDAAGLGSYTFKDLKRELGRRGFTVADLDKAELKRVVAVAIRRRHRALGEQRRYAHADRCSSAGAVPAPANDRSMLSAGMLQAIAQLAQLFPSVPASVMAGALGRAGGDVQLAADALLSVGQVSERDEDGDSEEMCVVCFTEPKTATIVHADTGHVCCCMECAKRLKVMRQPCPICRQPIDAVIRHFNS